MEKFLDLGRRDKIIFGFVLVVLFLTLVSGLNSETVQGECYEREIVCHGLPFFDCLGFESENVNIAESCEYEEDIKSECRNNKQVYEEQFGELPADWAENAYVNNVKCSKWIEAYNLQVEE